MKYILFLLSFLLISNICFAEPVGSRPPKEPKPFIPNISEPDEPYIDDKVPPDNMNIKEPDEIIIFTPNDKDIFSRYFDKEPEVPVYEPKIIEPKLKDPEPIIIVPDGEYHYICPKGMKCN